MILFPLFRSKRVAVQLREITLAEACAVCRLPADRHEATATEFLRFAASGATAPAPGYITDPRLWSVEERARLVCHYLSQVSDSGADFNVGEVGVLSDYLMFDKDMPAPAEVKLGEVAGAQRVLRPLLGVHAELLERSCENRGQWLIGVIAFQVHDAAVPEPNYSAMTDIELLEWGKARIAAVMDMPESEFEELQLAWERHRAELQHFFVCGVDDEGLVFWPHEEAGPKHPARFRALPCISEGTRRLFAGSDQPSR